MKNYIFRHFSRIFAKANILGGLAAALILLMGCGAATEQQSPNELLLGLLNSGSGNNGGASIAVRGNALSISDVTRVTISVTGPGINTPVVQDLVQNGSEWQGVLGGIPAGANRTFTAQAFDINNVLIYEGTAGGITIAPGQPPAIVILLQEVNPPAPFTNAAPIIDALTASGSQAAPGSSVRLNLAAHDPNPGDVLTYAWTATGGSFNDATIADPVWTAPSTTGLYTLSVTVADQLGAAATISLDIDVSASNGKGAGVITVGLNTFPVISDVSASPASIDRNESAALTLTVSDPDGDPMTFAWTSDCAGSFNDATAHNPIFTADAAAAYGACTLEVVADDGKGGTTAGSITILIAQPVNPNLAPGVLSAFQTALTVDGGGNLVFRVEANDPEGGSLSFNWTAGAGTLGASTQSATTNGTQSEISWTAPWSGTGIQISVTITDDIGLNTTYDFLLVDVNVPVFSGVWSSANSLSVTRYDGHTANLLTDGRVLVAGGFPQTAAAEIFDPSSGVWSTTGSMSEAREFHTATRLLDGRVLAVGGTNSGAYLTSAEIFDPSTGVWSTTGGLTVGRMDHTMTLLPDGRVLVVGGYAAGAYLASAEVYDPATGAWTSAGNLASARGFHRTVRLLDGRVLVTGGFNVSDDFLSSAEIYDPSTGTWSATGAMGTARYSHTLTLLPDGKVLAAAGANSQYAASAEIYDPTTGTWSSTGSLGTERYDHTATLLPDGQVLVFGGYNFGPIAAGEVFDPATGNWSSTGAAGTPRYYHTATLLLDGGVLFAGGTNDGNVEIAR